jgi:hypothetical protein
MLLNPNFQKIVLLHPSDEAEPGSGGDQPARNTLTGRNGTQGAKYPLELFLSHFSLLCLRKRMASSEAKK